MHMVRLGRWWWLIGAGACACRSHPAPRPAAEVAAESGGRTKEATAATAAQTGRLEANLLARFQGFLKEQGDVEVPELWARLRVAGPNDEPLRFDPRSVPYFDDIARKLALTPAEREIFRRQGFVSLDQRQRYSMGSAYYAIYTRDLPVLVTTDSILHAWHRSFDTALKQLEVAYFVPTLDSVLARASEANAKAAAVTHDRVLLESLKDVDLYFTVARNLIAGTLPPAGGAPKPPSSSAAAASLAVPPWLGDARSVEELLGKIAALKVESDENPTAIYGGRRPVDWSQFRPRGHYTESFALQSYFRCMIWLGRPDLGWNLGPRTTRFVDTQRERRDALLAVLALDRSGAATQLANVTRIVDFLVGRPDNVTPSDVHDALEAAAFGRLDDVLDAKRLARFDAALANEGARAQQIRSQVVVSPSNDAPAPLPLVFQIFGQRFALDGFLLANLVYDQIVYRTKKQERMLPSGLDVMAALGNDSATRLLKAELEHWHYASNLLAARRTVESLPAEAWSATAYAGWLAALRMLDDQPEEGAFPHVMRREAWRHKELRTALASWTELRHDTVLYVKQSYTASPMCEYPTGYVEPYPAFFARMAELAADLGQRLAAALPRNVSSASASDAEQACSTASAFFANFAVQMRELGALAHKELRQEPFTREEREFLKQTLDERGGGSGGPHYTGWYPRLFYATQPMTWTPVVTDVHTDPSDDKVLEEGTGDVQFLVAAIDNGPHRAAYVGPAYSYYEFTSSTAKRLTDPEWQARIESGNLPEPPAFTRDFQAPPAERALDGRVHAPVPARVPNQR
jgi:hypothetical protein